ncbi:MAG: 50S ribosomal protein L9 [Porphyromonadaceae bacterium]|nr:50S ribosomal protein L9 [Porphyromonadaceae bacterium]
MEVILKEDVINLGYKDDIVTVKNGYGRNFLIPQGKAIMATESAKKMLAENLKQRAHKLAAIKKEAEEKAAKLNGLKLVITVKTGVGGAIYGSVSNIQISEELAKKGLDIERKLISVKGVKALGSYTATVRFHKEVAVELPFEVVSENAPAPAVEEPKKEEVAPAEEA